MSRRTLLSLAIATVVGIGGQPARAEKMEEIVVTAQKRAEKLQDVPIAISAFTEESLKNAAITDTRSLTQVTPGLNFQMQGAYAQPTIRGIGTQGVGPGDEPNVATYVDGVYLPSMNSNSFELKGIQRIEVLKGPQGTLFGRNATGGLINIITKDPAFDTGGELSFSYGNFNAKKASLYATTGVTDTLAIDFSGLLYSDDGYVNDIGNGNDLATKKSSAGRMKLLYQPSQDVKVVGAFDYSDREDITTFSSAPLNGNTAGRRLNPNSLVPTDEFDAALNFKPVLNPRSFGGSLRVEAGFDAFNFTSISAYRNTQVHAKTDADASPVQVLSLIFDQDAESGSQEFNFASTNEGPWHWITGAFLYHQNAGLSNYKLSTATVTLPTFDTRVWTDAYAVFGEITYDFTDQLSAILGARYSHEKKATTAHNVGAAAPANAEGDEDWDSMTPRASIRYRISDTTNVYATYSEGFKSGTYNAASTTYATPIQPVEPEEIKAYEIGLKTEAIPDVVLNVAAFYYDYTNLQVQSFTATSTAVTSLLNAATATSKGVDLDGTAYLSDNLTARFGLAYLHARYDSFPNAPYFYPNPAGGNFPAVSRDAGGNDMIRSPEWTGNLGLDYTIPVSNGEILLTGNYFWSSGFYWQVDNRIKQGAYGLLNASAFWKPSDGRYRLGLWGTNLTDTVYEAYIGESGNADSVNYGQPRAYGASIDFYF